MLRDPVVWLPAGLVGLIRWNDFQSSMFNFHAVERQWYREQANLALQRGHETRDPTVRAGFDELVREWLRLAEQAEWIANQQPPPLTKRTPRE